MDRRGFVWDKHTLLRARVGRSFHLLLIFFSSCCSLSEVRVFCLYYPFWMLVYGTSVIMIYVWRLRRCDLILFSVKLACLYELVTVWSPGRSAPLTWSLSECAMASSEIYIWVIYSKNTASFKTKKNAFLVQINIYWHWAAKQKAFYIFIFVTRSNWRAMQIQHKICNLCI